MAHDIDESTGKAAVMIAGKAAWHKLGVNVAEAQASADAIKLAGLDWAVEKVALQTVEGREVPGKFATVRRDTGNVLGVVGNVYKPLQNVGAFSFMDSVIGEGLASYETAGALGTGERVWIMARIPQELRVKGTDDISLPYALLTNSHDGTAAVQVMPTSVRVVCSNTLHMAMGNAKRKLNVRHSGKMNLQLNEARRVLGLVTAHVKVFGQQMNALASVQVTASQAKGYFQTLLARPYKPQESDEETADRLLGRTPRVRVKVKESTTERNDRLFVEQLLHNFEHDATNTMRGIKGTAWAAVNAVTQYADHQGRTRATGGKTRLENRLQSMWFGSAAGMKEKAFSGAMETFVN